MVSDGRVVIREKPFHYEIWSDNSDVTVKIYRQGNKGENIEYVRDDRMNLKNGMEAALVHAQVIK